MARILVLRKYYRHQRGGITDCNSKEVIKKLQARIMATLNFSFITKILWIPAAARSKAWIWRRSLAEIVDSNTAGGMNVSLVSVVGCQVEVSASA
jgi:hypothetical protein